VVVYERASKQQHPR
jgi:hypothetical protein